MADDIDLEGTNPDLPVQDVYALLSKPVEELSEQETLQVCVELRKKRLLFLNGKKDQPTRKAKTPALKLTPTEKKEATEEALADFTLDL